MKPWIINPEVKKNLLSNWNKLTPYCTLDNNKHSVENLENPEFTLHTAIAALCSQVNVTDYLEIGTWRGYSLAAALAGNPNLRLYSLDIWMPQLEDFQEDFIHFGPKFISNEIRKILSTSITQEYHRPESLQPSSLNTSLNFLMGPSLQTIQKIGNESIDVALVDGDHSYAGAILDLQATWPKIRPGGWLVFDDLWAPELAKTFHQFTASVPHSEIAISTYYNGTGVLQKPYNNSEKVMH